MLRRIHHEGVGPYDTTRDEVAHIRGPEIVLCEEVEDKWL